MCCVISILVVFCIPVLLEVPLLVVAVPVPGEAALCDGAVVLLPPLFVEDVLVLLRPLPRLPLVLLSLTGALVGSGDGSLVSSTSISLSYGNSACTQSIQMRSRQPVSMP
jgi:hypothetical protein